MSAVIRSRGCSPPVAPRPALPRGATPAVSRSVTAASTAAAPDGRRLRAETRFLQRGQHALAHGLPNGLAQFRTRQEDAPRAVRREHLSLAPLRAPRKRGRIPLHTGLLP